jgi:cytochrome c
MTTAWPRPIVRLTLAVALLTPGRALAGDVAAGEQVFVRCASCHATEAGANGVGPSLFGVIGRRAGTAPGFRFSPAMVAFGRSWDATLLSAYLADPKGVVADTKMGFAGLKSAQDRDNVVTYLATLK